MSTAAEVLTRKRAVERRLSVVQRAMLEPLTLRLLHLTRLEQSRHLWREVCRRKAQGPVAWWGAPG